MNTRYNELIDFVDRLMVDTYCIYDVTEETKKCLYDIRRILVTIRNHDLWMNKWRDENGKNNSI